MMVQRKQNTSIYANKTLVCPHQFDLLLRTMYQSGVSSVECATLRVKGDQMVSSVLVVEHMEPFS